MSPLILKLSPHLVTNILQGFPARGREEFFRKAANLPKNRLPTSGLLNITHGELKTTVFPAYLFPSKRR